MRHESLEKEQAAKQAAREAAYKTLVDQFPNLNVPNNFLIGAEGLTANELVNKIEDLAALADLYEFNDRVFSFEIHGSLPVMYIAMGLKDPAYPDEGKILKKIYSQETYSQGKPYLSIWGEGWDPATLNPKMITHKDVMDNYYIEIVIKDPQTI